MNKLVTCIVATFLFLPVSFLETLHLTRKGLEELAYEGAKLPLQDEKMQKLWNVTEMKCKSNCNNSVESIKNVLLSLPVATDSELKALYKDNQRPAPQRAMWRMLKNLTNSALSVGKFFLSFLHHESPDEEKLNIEEQYVAEFNTDSYGYLQRDMDSLAVVVAYSFYTKAIEDVRFVTVSIRNFNFTVPLKIVDMQLEGKVIFQSKSSLWISISIKTNTNELLGTAYFCMVAMNGKSPVEIEARKDMVLATEKPCPNFRFTLPQDTKDMLHSSETITFGKTDLNIYGTVFGGCLVHEMVKFCFPDEIPHKNMTLNVNFGVALKEGDELTMEKYSTRDKIYVRTVSNNEPGKDAHQLEIIMN